MRKAEIELEYQPYVDLPVTPQALFQEACSNDAATVKAWRPTWEKNVRDNHIKYGSFAENSIAPIYGSARMQPVVVIGSGPSLKHNAHELKNRQGITTLSCLHNFHFLEDEGAPADYYVSLDAGEVVVEEVYEGGKRTPDEYWALTKERTLLCYIGTSPRLLEKWQGKVMFFNAPVPDREFEAAIEEIEPFHMMVSSGGNVLGACFYIAKAYMGASVIAFMGADFSFSYDKKFHGWDSKYDANLGNVLRVRDVFGLPVYTWKSYHNFKGWFECMAQTVPGIYYNCSEGGTLGAYENGNIRSIIQMPIKDFIRQMTIYSEIKEQAEDPKTKNITLLF